MQSLKERVKIEGTPTPPGFGTSKSALRESEDKVTIRAIDHDVFALSESLSISTTSPGHGLGLEVAHFFPDLELILIMELDNVVINEDIMSSARCTY